MFEPLKFYCISLTSYFSLYVYCIRFDSIEASTDIRWHYNHSDIHYSSPGHTGVSLTEALDKVLGILAN